MEVGPDGSDSESASNCQTCDFVSGATSCVLVTSSFLPRPVTSLLLVAMPGATSSFLFLVAMPGAPSSVLAPSSKARSP